MKSIKSTILAGAALAGLAPAMASPLTVEDYCDPTAAAPASVKEMTPLADGISYAAISDDGKSIETFSYKTGKKTGVLFSVDGVKGDLKIPQFEGYSISENGKKILLWNDSEKIYRYSFYAEYYVYDVMRQTLQRVSSQGAQRGAVISHDGRMVAYQRDNNIFISNLDYGTDRAITEDGARNKIIYGTPDWGYEEEFGILNTMRWSADDNVLAYMRFDESRVPEYTFDNVRSYCQSEPLGDPYPEQYSYKYALAGSPNSIVSVFAYNLNDRRAKKMDLPISDSDYVPSLEFDGQGQNLMAMVLNHDQTELKLYSVNPASTVAKLLLTERSEAWLSPQAYQMVKYGKDSFVFGSERDGYRHLYKYSYAGALLGQLTKGDYNVTNYYGYDAKTRRHYVQTTSLGAPCRSLAYIDAKGALQLMHGEKGTEDAWFNSDFSSYLRRFSNATTPPVYALYSNAGKLLVTVQDNAAYAAKYASAPKMEFMQVPNADGQQMNAYIIKPLDFDPTKKYPLLMYQYNGPDSQEVLDKWRMEGVFYLASQGYVVAAVDGRGTGNRTRAWSTAVYCKLGQLETADQIAGARHFASLPYVDADRMACFGWSYGGYMTLMELSAADTPFKAGVSMAPVTDWRWYDSIYTERYMLTPQQNAAGYDKASAMNCTDGMQAKLLIMSGTSDDNVHFYNTLKYTSKLNYEGRLFDMMAYTGFEHSLRMCNARVQLFRKVADFLSRTL